MQTECSNIMTCRITLLNIILRQPLKKGYKFNVNIQQIVLLFSVDVYCTFLVDFTIYALKVWRQLYEINY